MKCPTCEQQDLKSTIIMSVGTCTTYAYYVPFYDEDGVYHHHDENTLITQAQCSNGHNLVVKSQPACPAPNCHFKGMNEVQVRV